MWGRIEDGTQDLMGVQGELPGSLISKELLKMETILLTKTQKTGKTTSKQFLTAALEAHDSIYMFTVDNSVSLRRCGSS